MQIVGLSATLGIGGSTTEEGALKHMVRICANLDVTEISKVKVHQEEFRQRVHTAKHGKESVLYSCQSLNFLPYYENELYYAEDS